jgi:hypothetical protein
MGMALRLGGGVGGGGGGGAGRRGAAVWGRVARGRGGMIAAALLAIVLTWPSLYAGLSSDDFYQRWLLTARDDRYAAIRPPRMEMFSFLDGDPGRTRQMKQLGLLPWWVYDNVRARFWRPLTTLTHLADYRLWPQRIEWMHAQSIAWYAAVVILVAMLYRQMMGRTVAAALAVIMFAIDDAHAIPVGFLASRNALIAGVFGVLTIMCHHRWRLGAQPRRRRAGFAWMALASFIAGLLSAEAGIATFGYLVAYEIALDRGRWTQRVAAIAPYLIAIAMWRAVWKWLGYGVAAWDALYTDPLAEPMTFIGDVLIRLPLLLGGQAAYPPADVGLVVNGAGRVVFALVGVAIVALSVWMLWGLLRHNRVARFWVIGLVLAGIPLCAPAPSNRMLLFIGIGAFGLAGQFLSMALHASFWTGLSRPRRLGRFSFVAATVITHFVFAPTMLFLQSHWPLGWPDMWEAIQEIPEITAADSDRDLIIVNHPLAISTMYALITRAYDGRPTPRTTTVLAPSSSLMVVSRLDERTLLVRVDGGFFPDTFARLFYSAQHPPAVNVPIDLPTARITVLKLSEDNGPAEVRFEFKTPLEDASIHWMCWRNGSFQPFKPPAIGQSVQLPRGRFPF